MWGETLAKGGVEILRAFDALDADWHLTIVSSLSVDDYATQYTKLEQHSISQEISTILNKRKNQITWHASLPNKHVLEVMKTSHVDFFQLGTTLMDTVYWNFKLQGVRLSPQMSEHYLKSTTINADGSSLSEKSSAPESHR